MLCTNPFKDTNIYAENAQCTEVPSTEDYCNGVCIGYSLPAKWWNGLWCDTTTKLHNAYSLANNTYNELSCVLSAAGVSPNDGAAQLTGVVALCNLPTVKVGASTEVGCNSVAIGNGAKANSCYSVSLGYGTCANIDNGIVIGNQAKATCVCSTAIGVAASAAGGTAVGPNSSAAICSTAIGSYAQAGSCGVAIGYQAGSYSTAYCNTVAIGTTARALGHYGLSIGYNAASNHYGSNNLAIGSFAMYGASNSTSSYNTAIGVNALRNINTGGNNLAIGINTACANTVGNNLVAIGYNALRNSTTGSDHTAIGASALENLTTGLYNTAIGSRALCGLTTGCENFGLGIDTGWAITTGCNNTLIGNNTGMGITGGSSENTLIGKNIACASSGVLCEATIIGSKASPNVTGIGNTAIGYCALSALTTGIGNTVVGRYAGNPLTIGCYNALLGYEARTYTNATSYGVAIGYNAMAGAESIAVGPNSCTIGGAGQAIGSSAYAHNYATAIGLQACAGISSVSIGPSANRVLLGSECYAVSIGNGTCSCTQGTALGNGASAGCFSTAIGTYSWATANFGIAIGCNARTICCPQGIAIGYQSCTNGTASVAIGNCSKVYGCYNTALGYNSCIICGNRNIAISGDICCSSNNIVIGDASGVTGGGNNIIVGEFTSLSCYAIGIGVGNALQPLPICAINIGSDNSNGSRSISIGHCVCSCCNSIAIGHCVSNFQDTDSTNVVIGKEDSYFSFFSECDEISCNFGSCFYNGINDIASIPRVCMSVDDIIDIYPFIPATGLYYEGALDDVICKPFTIVDGIIFCCKNYGSVTYCFTDMYFVKQIFSGCKDYYVKISSNLLNLNCVFNFSAQILALIGINRYK